MMTRVESGPVYMSPDGVYRYWLMRTWGKGERHIAWIGLNPSTADAQRLDPTLRRIYDFSEAWGYDGFIMLNLFAFRATQPRVMLLHHAPVGPDNDPQIRQVASQVDKIMCAWGAHGLHRNRSQEVLDMLTRAGHGAKLHALKVNANGTPKHPLYVGKTAEPFPYPVAS